MSTVNRRVKRGHVGSVRANWLEKSRANLRRLWMTKHSPSIVRIVPEHGCVEGNVVWKKKVRL